MELTELTIRDWMVVAGVLLIIAVLFRAARQVSKDRRASVRMNLVPEGGNAEKSVDLTWHRELPNGGGRPVQRDDLLRATGLDSRLDDSTQQEEPSNTSHSAVDLIDGMSATDEPRNLDWLESADPAGEGAVAQDEPRLPRAPNPEVFMFNVVSREPAGFKGEDILHILLACDLRFGDMSFFHRHEQEAGRGPIQFSVANMMQPGVFDIDNMSDFDTPGLVFFLTLPGPDDMMQAFDYMLETAQAVSRNLSGDVLDESRSAVTKQALDHSRQQIRDLERRMLTQAQH
ncbi:MAG: cell division protein ZipA [Halioglobus sp.]|jgi:cell division protein ZipA